MSILNKYIGPTDCYHLWKYSKRSHQNECQKCGKVIKSWRDFKLSEIIPQKCNNCKHRKNVYCRAYQIEIGLINVEKCKRKKGTALSFKKIINLYHCKVCGYHSPKKNEYCPECEAFGVKNKLEYPWEFSIFSRGEYEEIMSLSKEDA